MLLRTLFTIIKIKKHCSCKPGSVPPKGSLSFIYSNDGIHELAVPSRHSLMITHQLVVSYTTFSPLPTLGAVVFFCRHLLSPIASIFRSGAPYTARTFLSYTGTSDRPEQCFQSYNKYRLQIVVILHIKCRGGHITCFVTFFQPALTLIGGTMGE